MLERIVAEAPTFFTASNGMFLLAALARTLGMTLIGCSIGFAVGLGIAVVRGTRSPWLLPLRLLGTLFVETFRRIPFLVILFIVLFVIQPLVPRATLFTIATVSVVMVATAFLSEIIRAGLESVPRQQIEGAAALNFSPIQTLLLIVLPQSWRVILPPAAAFVVMFIKDTSLASHLGVVELTFAGKMLVNNGFSPVLGFGAILLLYFALSYPLSRMAARLETRLAPSRHP